MHQLKLIAGAWLLEGGRWARANLYALLVLGPLVLGMTYFGVGRMVREAAWSPTEAQTLAAGVLAAACLVALSLSRASVEVYHVRRPEWVLDALPVSMNVQLSAALARRAGHACAVGAVALVLRWLAGGVFGATIFASAALLVCVLASGAVLSALVWVRWSHRRGAARALALVVSVVVCALVTGALLASVVRPDALTLFGRTSLFMCGVVTAVALAAAAFAVHARWRAADSEFAQRLGARERWGALIERFARRACRDNETLAAQLARDLRLVLRGFSSAVYAAAGVGALLIALLVGLLAGDVLAEGEAEGFGSMTWLPKVLAVKFACVLATAALASLVPVLVAHQEPHLWLERSVGLKGEDAWRAKLYLARVVTAPAAAAAWVAGLVCGAVPAVYAVPLLAECVWLWWLVSTAAGGLAFEMPAQPGLALILVLCAGLAAGGLTAFLWPIGLAVYGFAVQPLCMRGAMRADMHLKGFEI